MTDDTLARPSTVRRAAVSRDGATAIAFGVLTVAFVVAMATVPAFFDWTFARHHNVVSWYVRPLFLIPLCLFAYRRSLAGISITVFLLATSMFWFPAPASPDPSVAEFLQIEMDYITSPWGPAKVVGTALVPLTLGALAVALWRRNLYVGLIVLVLIAVLKMTWSVLAAGDSGFGVFAPAIIGLLLCTVLVWYGFRRAEKSAGAPRIRARRSGRA